MRIVHISDCYLPRLGGIEMQVRELGRQLLARGHEVSVITATPGHDAVRSGLETIEGIDVHRVAARLPFELPVHPRVAHHTAAILEEIRPDVVHVHGGVVSPFAYPAGFVASGRGIPTVLTIHSVWGRATPAFSLANQFTGWGRRGVLPSAVSRVAAEPLRQVLGGEVRVLPNGIAPEDWAIGPDVAVGSGDSRTVRVVATMRLAPRKRPIPLLEMLLAARHRLARGIRLELVVAGNGPGLARMQEFIDERGMADWVTLAGRLDRAALQELYRGADVFIAPALLESFGLAGLEARTAGIPVLAYSCTGATEYITEGREGLLAADDAGMIDALVRLARDAGLRASMSAYNRSHEPTTTWDRVLGRVLEAYDAAGRRA